tara:strand:+ start:261 stop:422 length:162 start_codon:yes stop_codon:yes gene_type:complete
MACDRALSDYESTRKSSVTGEYVDLCNRCAVIDDEDIIGNPDLAHEDDFSDEE